MKLACVEVERDDVMIFLTDDVQITIIDGHPRRVFDFCMRQMIDVLESHRIKDFNVARFTISDINF